jgi:hypothetical protein
MANYKPINSWYRTGVYSDAKYYIYGQKQYRSTYACLFYTELTLVLTLKNVHFVKLSKYGTDFTIAFLSSRRSKNIYGTSNSESGWRSYAPEKMLYCRDFRPKSGLPTAGTANPSRDFRRPGLLTRAGTSDPCRNFRHMSGLLTVGTADPSRDFR